MLSRPHWPVKCDGRIGQGAYAYTRTLKDAWADGFVVVLAQTKRLEPLEMGFPIKRQLAARDGGDARQW